MALCIHTPHISLSFIFADVDIEAVKRWKAFAKVTEQM